MGWVFVFLGFLWGGHFGVLATQLKSTDYNRKDKMRKENIKEKKQLSILIFFPFCCFQIFWKDYSSTPIIIEIHFNLIFGQKVIQFSM